MGKPMTHKKIHPVTKILQTGAATFAERNAVYGDNFEMVGRVMKAMFPHGVTLVTMEDFLVWHTFELSVVKLSRLAASGLTHKDSVQDLMVYSGILQHLMNKRGQNATPSINNTRDRK